MTGGILVPPSLRHFRMRHVAFSAWLDHSPFGYDIVAEVRPKTLVELGTHNAQSYFVFCQSMQEHDIDGVCFAVDTWEGDEHAGRYSDDVYARVQGYNRENYPGFSYLMRMRFEQAVAHFADESIDLLHIDGLHSYDAVSTDFATWWPRVRPGGIVLFHDIESRMSDYGVWRFWDEIKGEYPSFAFRQGFGLGVIRKPGGSGRSGPLQDLMFEGSAADHGALRALYATAARSALMTHWADSGDLSPRFE